MSSLFKLNQLSAHHEAPTILEESKTTLESNDREIYALRQQLQALKTLYKNSKAQVDLLSKKNPADNSIETAHAKQRIEKLMAVLAEREKQMRIMQVEAKQQQAIDAEEWQKERQAKLVAIEEITALQGQLEFLKTRVISSQSVIKTQQEKNQSLQEERKAALDQLQIAESIVEQNSVLQSNYEKLRLEALNLSAQLNSSGLVVQEFKEKLQVYEEQNSELRQKNEQLEKSLIEAEQRLQLVNREKALYQENAFKAQSAQEDAEARLKIAHFHLAKKVKEATQLNDKTRDLEGHEVELTTDLKLAQDRILELQKLLEEQCFQEKRRQEHLQDSLHDTEALAGAWEKKYFTLYADWQAHDIRLKEFRHLEEKLFQMKSVWTSFGKFFEEASLSTRYQPEATLNPAPQSPQKEQPLRVLD